MASAARRQIIGCFGGAPINKRRRRLQIVGGAAPPAHGSTLYSINDIIIILFYFRWGRSNRIQTPIGR